MSRRVRQRGGGRGRGGRTDGEKARVSIPLDVVSNGREDIYSIRNVLRREKEE